MTIAERLEALGYGRPGVEIDETLHRLLDDYMHLRAVVDRQAYVAACGHADWAWGLGESKYCRLCGATCARGESWR